MIPVLFKGAGPGTHWHANDARILGFASAAQRPHTKNAVIRIKGQNLLRHRLSLDLTRAYKIAWGFCLIVLSHITAYSFPSPYVSLTTSFAVARQYALSGPGGIASRKNPGYVYEVDLSACIAAPTIFNPVTEVSKANLAHAHDGSQSLILGVASPAHSQILGVKVLHSGGLRTLPNISAEMRALVNALRDAEVLVNTIPSTCVVMRHEVF